MELFSKDLAQVVNSDELPVGNLFEPIDKHSRSMLQAFADSLCRRGPTKSIIIVAESDLMGWGYINALAMLLVDREKLLEYLDMLDVPSNAKNRLVGKHLRIIDMSQLVSRLQSGNDAYDTFHVLAEEPDVIFAVDNLGRLITSQQSGEHEYAKALVSSIKSGFTFLTSMTSEEYTINIKENGHTGLMRFANLIEL